MYSHVFYTSVQMQNNGMYMYMYVYMYMCVGTWKICV